MFHEWLAPSLKVAKKTGILKYSKGFLNNCLLIMDSQHKDYENYLISFTKASHRVERIIEEADIDLSGIEDPEYNDPIMKMKFDEDGNPIKNGESVEDDSDTDGEVVDDETSDPEKPVGWNKFAVNFLSVDSGDHREYGQFLHMARIKTDHPRLVFFQMNMNTFSKPTIFESNWKYSNFDPKSEQKYIEVFENFVLDVMQGKILSRDQKSLQKDEL